MTERTTTLALALFALVLVATDVAAEIQPNTWLFRDGRFYTNVNENIVQNLSLEDPFADSWYSGTLGWNHELSADFSNRALGARGERYHFRPWLLPVLSTPLYFALGLLGVLAFNCLLYAFVAAATYRFVRAYAEPIPAAVVAVAMVLASGFRHHVYNYSVDMLLVTAFLCALWGLVEKKGWAAGALVAAAVMIKPTVLLYAPALALVMWEREDGRTLKEAIYGGSMVLGLYGLSNWYMFGRPWWTGYTRVAVVEHGELGVHTDTAAFTTPFEDGAMDLLSGPDGLVWWHGLFVLALPGLVVLLRRFPRSGLAILLSGMGAFYLFAKFAWHHDRFLFPSVALFSVPLALGLRWAARGLSSLLGGVVPVRGVSALVFVAALVVALTSALTGGALATRHPDDAAIQGAIALGEGSFDLREASSDVSVVTSEPGSTVALGGDDAWRPRASPLALLPFAPLGHAFGVRGVLVGSSLTMAGVIVALAWLLRRRLPAPLSAAAALGALLVGPMREAAIGRPVETLGALLLVSALARAVHEEGDQKEPFILSAVLGGLSGVVLEQPLLSVLSTLGLVALARFRGRALVLPVLGAGLATVALGLLGNFLVWGHPLWVSETHVVIAGDGTLSSPGLATALDALALLSEGPSLSRATLPLLFFLPLAALGLAAHPELRDRRLMVALAVLVAALGLPGVALRHGTLSPLAIVTLIAATALVVFAFARALSRQVSWTGARHPIVIGAAVALALCLALGVARRVEAAREPFWIGTPASVRSATVLLGDAPCDFLAWENMAWECAMLDGGAMGRVGLALPDRPRVAGRSVHLLLIPTGLRRTAPRIVRWEHVPVGPRLFLVAGAPDGDFTSGAHVTVRIDGTGIGTFDVPRGEGGLLDHTYDTSAFSGEVTLELELEATHRGQQAAVVIGGGFVD
jgi:hypothetical protein